MRRIKVGDRVQAFLDSRVIGTVVSISVSDNVPWMVGGTASGEYVCELKLDSGHTIPYKLSELHHVDV